MRFLILIVFIIGWLDANIGVFSGDGFSLEFINNKYIKLVNEEVEVTPIRGDLLFDGTFKGMDKVRYKCRFRLKNSSSSSIRVRVAFPLNSEQVTLQDKNFDSKMELISFYNFIAQDKNQVFDVKFMQNIKNKEYKNLFSWDIGFNPMQSKDIYISYTMPISMNVISSAKKSKKYQKEWYKILERSIIEYFGYVSKTASTWAGDIEYANFTIKTNNFEKYLNNRPFMEITSKSLLSKTTKKFSSWHSPMVFRVTKGFDFDIKKNNLIYNVHSSRDLKKGFMVKYYILNLPTDIYSVDSLLDSLRTKGFNTKDDYQDLIDILKEFNGVKTGNSNIYKFIKNQVWFHKKSQKTVPIEVLEYLNTNKNIL